MALRDVPTITIVFSRVLTATVVLWCALLISRQPIPRGYRTWGSLFLMALLNSVVPVSLTAWSQTQIKSSLAAILAASSPVIVVVLAHFLTDNERLSLIRLTGTIIGFAGVGVIIGPQH
ncbi:EamA family transporter [Phyllobacterium sp. K27]